MASPEPMLKGIRVIEVGTYIFGPAAATVLSDFGAEVIKIEAPGIGDPYRYLHLIHPMPKSEKAYCWLLDGRNKKSVVVDLKQDEGREIVLKLTRDADVFLTNYHPSVLEDLRLGYEELAPLNEKLIYAHATGYGETGPETEKPGYDMTAWWARSGLMNLIHAAGAEPALSVAGMGDHPSAMSLLSGIALALYHRERTGKGQKVSTSLQANGIWSNACFIQSALCGAEPYELQNRAESYNALVNHYTSRDGRRFILCGIRADKDWIAVCRAIERDDLLEDPRFATPENRVENMTALVGVFDAAFQTRDLDDWHVRFEKVELTYSPVSDYVDLPDDPQLNANGIFIDMEHPVHGPMRTIDSPVFLNGAPKVKPAPAPELGQHTAEVLATLGYDEEDIRHLAERGVVALYSASAGAP